MIEVLVVDDDPGLLELTSIYFEKDDDISVTTSRSAHDALEKVGSHPFDVVISDYWMPGMDGLEFLRELRGGGHQMPFVIVTGQGREEIVIEAINNGADFYLQKGIKPASFYAEMHHMIRQAAKRWEAENALLESEEKFRLMVETAPSILHITDENGMTSYVSPNCLQITGYTQEELKGRVLWPVVTEDARRIKAALDESIAARQGRRDFEYRGVKKDGTIWHALSSWEPLLDAIPGQGGFVIQTLDLTERKKAEEELARYRDRLEDLVEERTADLNRMNRMLKIEIAEREKVSDALEEREALFHRLFNTMKNGAIIFSRSGDEEGNFAIRDINYTGCEILARDPENLIGNESEDFLPNLLGPRVAHAIPVVMKSGHPLFFPPIEFFTGDTSQWREFYVYRLSSGEVVAIFDDVTGRVVAESRLHESIREKEILIKEVHHRVKNNLQIIASILKIQDLRSDDEKTHEILKTCRNRVFSMAMIHEKLYRSESLSLIGMKGYIQSLADHLSDQADAVAQETAITVNCPTDLQLDIDTAIPCGLILNELVTNAIKYAFAPGEEGEITISMDRAGPAAYTLSVKNNGSILPDRADLENAQTLGMELVRNLVLQLRGELEISVDQETSFVITFPARRDQGL